MNRFSRLFATSALALAACGVASATPIVAGQSGVVPTFIAPTNINVLATYNNVAYTSAAVAPNTPTFSGTYTASVFRDSSNMLCGVANMCLTFGIQVNNNSTSRDGIETVTTGPFSNAFLYNVGYNNTNSAFVPAGGVVPLFVNDTAQGTISFNFTSPTNTANMINNGQGSSYLLIQSSAMNYTFGNVSFQDSQTATVAGFVPAAVAVTPEPSSLVLLGTGLIGTATTLLRRRKLVA